MGTPTEHDPDQSFEDRPQTLYGVLGVDRDAPVDVIRAAWKALARRLHPDAGGDPAEFDRALKAYETLSDQRRRDDYDLELAKDPYSDPDFDPVDWIVGERHGDWQMASRRRPRITAEKLLRERRLRLLNEQAFDADGNLRTMGPPPPRPRAPRSPMVVLAGVAVVIIIVALFGAAAVTIYNQLPLPGSPANGW